LWGHAFVPWHHAIRFYLRYHFCPLSSVAPRPSLRPVGLRTLFLRQSYQCDRTVGPPPSCGHLRPSGGQVYCFDLAYIWEGEFVILSKSRNYQTIIGFSNVLSVLHTNDLGEIKILVAPTLTWRFDLGECRTTLAFDTI
ncbi:MAG: hypothetical protein ACRBG0_27305, partial [Lewinella sp.]|uniref:hypothetical protein n=1 Tax=Lewinella sp. TaxID=2004506 RepID=UPI003D6A0321